MKIVIRGDPGNHTGYSNQQREFINAISTLPDIDIALPNFDALNSLSVISKEEHKKFSEMRGKDITKTDMFINFVIPPLYIKHPAAKSIGVIAWETDIIIDSWLKHLQSMDEIWTFSHHNYELLTNVYKLPKVVRIFGTVDTNFWQSDKKRTGNSILYIADWNARKNIEQFLYLTNEIYLKYKNKVTLKLSGIKKEDAKKLLNSVYQNIPLDHVNIVDSLMSTAEIKELIDLHDIYLCTSHGEGFNLPLIQAGLMGLECIAANHTAHKYLNISLCNAHTTYINPTKIYGDMSAYKGTWSTGFDYGFIYELETTINDTHRGNNNFKDIYSHKRFLERWNAYILNG